MADGYPPGALARVCGEALHPDREQPPEGSDSAAPGDWIPVARSAAVAALLSGPQSQRAWYWREWRFPAHPLHDG